MKRLWIFAILLSCPVPAFGQTTGTVSPPYQPAVPAPSVRAYGVGGCGYGYGGAAWPDLAGSAMQGMSQVISAAGEYNLATSAAAINMTQAQSNALRNQVQSVQTFWDMRNIGRAERAKDREATWGPRPTAEQLARMARDGAPRALNTAQIDPVSGELKWPGPLQDDTFKSQRGAVDQCAAKWAKYGALDYDEQTQVRENVDTMYAGLKSQIASIRPQDYMACKTFLQSLLYATTRTTL